MKIKNCLSISVIILLSAGFTLLGFYSVGRYRAVEAREAGIRLLQQELRKADAIADDGAAVAAYKKLQPMLPEIQLRILQRQWRIALELLNYLQRAKSNVDLQDKTGIYSVRLKTLLDEMLDRCAGIQADTASLRPDIQWQTYNAAGSAKVLTAFIMLENEQSAEKAQGVMRDALTNYKAAIEAVDKAGVPPLQRNIPRWNFEMLNGEEYVKKYEVAMSDTERNQVLKENLETLMPEMGGYAPGEPVETRVEK